MVFLIILLLVKLGFFKRKVPPEEQQELDRKHATTEELQNLQEPMEMT